jgi:hypothetical protein
MTDSAALQADYAATHGNPTFATGGVNSFGYSKPVGTHHVKIRRNNR